MPPAVFHVKQFLGWEGAGGAAAGNLFAELSCSAEFSDGSACSVQTNAWPRVMRVAHAEGQNAPVRRNPLDT
jgi:hypothetical protein